MECQILGRLECVGAAGLVEVSGPKRRALLAYLIAHNGAVISVDRIVDDLWDGSPSEGAVGTVRTYISQLRKVLPADCAIETHPGAYRLVARACTVDAERFEHLSASAASTADPEARLLILDDALRLWSGAPLAEFSGSLWADAIAARLEAVWLTAVRLRFDTMLQVGRHAEALHAIESMARDHPLDEHLWAQLMLAYYRAGRQADALGAFQEVRGALVDQLGLDPGPELRDLERRILDQDPDLTGGFENLAVRARPVAVASAAANRQRLRPKILATASAAAACVVILLFLLVGSIWPRTSRDGGARSQAQGADTSVDADLAPPTDIGPSETAPPETAPPETTPPETTPPQTTQPTRQAAPPATSPPAASVGAPQVASNVAASPTFAVYPDDIIHDLDGTP